MTQYSIENKVALVVKILTINDIILSLTIYLVVHKWYNFNILFLLGTIHIHWWYKEKDAQ